MATLAAVRAGADEPVADDALDASPTRARRTSYSSASPAYGSTGGYGSRNTGYGSSTGAYGALSGSYGSVDSYGNPLSASGYGGYGGDYNSPFSNSFSSGYGGRPGRFNPDDIIQFPKFHSSTFPF